MEVATVCNYMLRTLDGSHPAVPLAMICLAGLVGAVFEDWLFAVGYYLSVFVWSLAFCLVDVTRHPIAAEIRSAPGSARQLFPFFQAEAAFRR